MTAAGGADPRLLRLSAALLVEQAVRSRTGAAELYQELVNGTARCHGHDLGLLCLRRGGGFRLVAATAVAQTDRTGPLAQWLEAAAKRLQQAGAPAIRILSAADLAMPADDWAAGLPPHWLWLPLPAPTGGIEGVLALARHQPWQDADRLLAEPLAHCYGHALWARRNRLPDLPAPTRRQLAAAAVALVALSQLPVRLDTLAPAEIAAADPVPVAAPFDGVVADMAVRPYQAVRAGDVLVTFDARDLAAKRDAAAKTLDVAEAELASLRNQAFLDPDSKNKIAVAQAKVALERDALDHAEQRYQRHKVVAVSDGVVLYDDRLSLKGKPVVTGQSLMTLADPARVEVRVDIPVAALIPSRDGDEVRLFLDMDPSRPVRAHLTRRGFEARPLPGGGLAYRFVAALDPDSGPVQLGARGTAKVYGEPVTLAYYLVRRPWAALRQFLGV